MKCKRSGNKKEIEKDIISRPTLLLLNITNTEEKQKDKLRGAIKYFAGDRVNMNVAIKIGEEIKSCGQIYLTDEILKIFEEIVGKEQVEIK